MRTFASYNVQIGLDKNERPTCVLLILDGLVQQWAAPNAVCSARIHNNDLEISVNTESITLSDISREITDLLLKGFPLVVKHTASGLEAIATVS